MASTGIAQMVNWHDNVRYRKHILIWSQSPLENIILCKNIAYIKYFVWN